MNCGESRGWSFLFVVSRGENGVDDFDVSLNAF